MKDGTVVVMTDGVVGTVVGRAMDEQGDKLVVLTNKGFLRNVKPDATYEWQQGIETKEENDVGSKSQGEAAPPKRKGSK